MASQKLFEGTEKTTLSDNDRIATAIEGQEGSSWISFLNLFTQIKNAIVGLFANKDVLDDISDVGGVLTYNGQPVANTAASGSSTEVQFRNETTGALDSDPLFKYDKDTGVLLAGKSFRDIPALGNLFAGFESGKSNTTGSLNAFIGSNSGKTNTTGNFNTFVGCDAGKSNTSGDANSFVGYNAGSSNTIGASNTFVGRKSGESNTTGGLNAFIGSNSGKTNTTGNFNTFVGCDAGKSNTTGNFNSFVGYNAGSGYDIYNHVIAIGREITKTVKSSYDFILGIGSYLFLEGNMAEGTRWFRVNAAQLIRAFEITSIAPVVTGTVTSGTTNTLTDSTKTYISNQYANFVVEKTTVGGEKEQRVIVLNTVAGQLTVRDNWTVTPVAGDTFKIITATIITADNLGSIYRFNLSSGYDHALILPTVTDTFNRAFCEFYIEGHANGAVLHKFPASGQLIQGQPKTEMVANREMVRLISHAQSTYHWDVESTVGLEAYVSATAATQSVVAPNTTFTPITSAVTVLRSKRFQQVNIGGQVWIKYTSSLGRSMQVGIGAAVVNQSTPATVITVGIRLYKAATATTTDYTLVGSQEQLATTGQLKNFVLADIFELESGDRLQIVHKASNNNNYDITPSLQIR